MDSAGKVWFVTGSSRGFGRIWVEAALERGDSVAATARSTEALAPLVDRFGDRVLPIALDVTDRAAVDAAVGAAVARFGRIDVVVNNAGYGLFGAVEEVSEQEAREQFETNFFGALWVTQAVMPVLRAQRSGHILQISSVGGVAAFPTLGIYNASKWALEAMSESLAAEVAEFGVRVTLVEPGGYATDWSGPSAVRAAELDVYDGMRERRRAAAPAQAGDPAATPAAILAVVDSDDPPLRLLLGTRGPTFLPSLYAARLAEWESWREVSVAAQGS